MNGQSCHTSFLPITEKSTVQLARCGNSVYKFKIVQTEYLKLLLQHKDPLNLQKQLERVIDYLLRTYTPEYPKEFVVSTSEFAVRTKIKPWVLSNILVFCNRRQQFSAANAQFILKLEERSRNSSGEVLELNSTKKCVTEECDDDILVIGEQAVLVPSNNDIQSNCTILQKFATAKEASYAERPSTLQRGARAKRAKQVEATTLIQKELEGLYIGKISGEKKYLQSPISTKKKDNCFTFWIFMVILTSLAMLLILYSLSLAGELPPKKNSDPIELSSQDSLS